MTKWSDTLPAEFFIVAFYSFRLSECLFHKIGCIWFIVHSKIRACFNLIPFPMSHALNRFYDSSQSWICHSFRSVLTIRRTHQSQSDIAKWAPTMRRHRTRWHFAFATKYSSSCLFIAPHAWRCWKCIIQKIQCINCYLLKFWSFYQLSCAICIEWCSICKHCRTIKDMIVLLALSGTRLAKALCDLYQNL